MIYRISQKLIEEITQLNCYEMEAVFELIKGNIDPRLIRLEADSIELKYLLS